MSQPVEECGSAVCLFGDLSVSVPLSPLPLVGFAAGGDDSEVGDVDDVGVSDSDVELDSLGSLVVEFRELEDSSAVGVVVDDVDSAEVPFWSFSSAPSRGCSS